MDVKFCEQAIGGHHAHATKIQPVVFSIIVISTLIISSFSPSRALAQAGDGLKREVNAASGRVSFIGQRINSWILFRFGPLLICIRYLKASSQPIWIGTEREMRTFAGFPREHLSAIEEISKRSMVWLNFRKEVDAKFCQLQRIQNTESNQLEINST